METNKFFEFKLTKTKNPNLDFSKYESRIISSEIAYEVFLEIFGVENIGIREYFYVLYLNNNNKVMGYSMLSMGGMTGTVVDIRILLKEALLCDCTAIMLAHNHPSGKLQPSDADIQITKKIKEAVKFFDIQLLDHLIITDVAYFGFADEGIL